MRKRARVRQVYGRLRISATEAEEARRARAQEPRLAGLPLDEVVWTLRRRRYMRAWWRRKYGARPRLWREYTVQELQLAEQLLLGGHSVKSVLDRLQRVCTRGLRRALEREGYAVGWLRAQKQGKEQARRR